MNGNAAAVLTKPAFRKIEWLNHPEPAAHKASTAS
jgi:hypothetical protein